MLMLFRSKQSGQSWIAASVIVTETAALCVSMIDATSRSTGARLCRRTAQTAARPRRRDRDRGRQPPREPTSHFPRSDFAPSTIGSASSGSSAGPTRRCARASTRGTTPTCPTSRPSSPACSSPRVPPPARGRRPLLRLSFPRRRPPLALRLAPSRTSYDVKCGGGGSRGACRRGGRCSAGGIGELRGGSFRSRLIVRCRPWWWGLCMSGSARSCRSLG